MKCESKVGIIALSNLALAGVSNLLDKVSQILHLLLVMGQVGVATMTILYIYRKIKALKKSK